jgi:hypothetical protein
MKPKKILLNLLLLLGTLLFSLVVLEVGLRFFAPQGLTKSQIEPDLGWINVPNTRYVFHHKEFNTPIHYNSYGMRDLEHTRSKPPGVFRIAVLGDSFMEGRQVPFDSLYSRVLERLRSPGLPDQGLAVSKFPPFHVLELPSPETYVGRGAKEKPSKDL